MLAIGAPSFHQASETFVRKHVEQILPGRTVLLCEDGDRAEELRCPTLSFLTAMTQPVSFPERLSNAWWSRWQRYVNPSLRGADEARARKFLLHNKVEAVLAQFGPIGCLIMEPCRKAGIPLYVHFHGYDATRLCREPNWLRHYRKLFKIATGVIVPSNFLRSRLEVLGCPSAKLHVSTCGVEVPSGSAIDPSHSRFIAVGRFVDKKAPMQTLRAFEIVARSHDKASLQMIGEGPLLESCVAEAKRLGIEDRVDFRGAVDHEEVKSAILSSFAFVQHSVEAPDGDCEGLPVAILEAMAAGLPVVSTRHSGIPEAVIEGETGYLTDEHNVDGMAEGMKALLMDPQRAAEMGKLGRDRVRAHFTHEKTAANLRSIMQLG